MATLGDEESIHRDVRREGKGGDVHEDQRNIMFGGLQRSINSSPPLCKHLLACLLAEAWPSGFGTFVAEHSASDMELAALAAGWSPLNLD